MYKRIIIITTFIVATTFFYACCCYAESVKTEINEQELKTKVQQIYDFRAKCLQTGASSKNIETLYDLSTKHGRWAYDHEQNKINFMQNWAKNRGVKYTNIKTNVILKNVKITDNTAKCNVYQSMSLSYKYPGTKILNSFGIGTTHWLELTHKDGKWLIKKEFYTDGLGDDTLVYRPQPDEGLADVGVLVNKVTEKKLDSNSKYNRAAAVAYADKYAGLAWGAGNNGKYNKKYQNLNGLGGDCTNFVSQCLGDKEGGNIPTDGSWHCSSGQGSLSWVRTVAFAHWLTYSGTATKLTKGTFSELNQPNDEYDISAIRELMPGDVIGYEEKGKIQHFAIVTGYDSKGYPMVNAHTVDRFHCPWDMGWDKKTIFHLYKIK